MHRGLIDNFFAKVCVEESVRDTRLEPFRASCSVEKCILVSVVGRRGEVDDDMIVHWAFGLLEIF